MAVTDEGPMEDLLGIEDGAVDAAGVLMPGVNPGAVYEADS
jgi:hypothetical protein